MALLSRERWENISLAHISIPTSLPLEHRGIIFNFFEVDLHRDKRKKIKHTISIWFISSLLSVIVMLNFLSVRVKSWERKRTKKKYPQSIKLLFLKNQISKNLGKEK